MLLSLWGCDKNLVDAEVALGKLLSGGYNFFSSPEEAEILILNTCAFIEEACQETEDWIKKLSLLKQAYPLKIAGYGMLRSTVGKEKHSLYPAVDYWVGVNDFPFVVSILEVIFPESFFLDSPFFLYDHRTERMLSTPLTMPISK